MKPPGAVCASAGATTKPAATRQTRRLIPKILRVPKTLLQTVAQTGIDHGVGREIRVWIDERVPGSPAASDERTMRVPNLASATSVGRCRVCPQPVGTLRFRDC